MSYPHGNMTREMRTDRRKMFGRLGNEAGASVLGMMAVLALPALIMPTGDVRRPLVQVEVLRGEWRRIDSVAITDTAIVVMSRDRQYVFPLRRPPRWRYVGVRA